MATPIPADHWVVKLRWRLTGDNEEMVSTLALRGTEPGPREPDEVAHATYMAWIDSFQPINLNSSWSFVGVDCIVGSDTEDHEVGTWNEISAGGMPNAALPQNCAMLIKKKTAKAGRRNSGRMYIPSGYLAEADVSNTGQIAGASLGAYQSWATNFYDSMTDAGTVVGQPPTSFFLSLLHSEPTDDDGNVTGPAPIPTQVNQLVVDPVIATMRKRLRR